MRVLLTNHHLADRAGSELLVTELAEGLVTRGHEVAIFTLFPGGFAEEYAPRSEIEIFSPLSVDALRASAPDVIHVTHWPTIVHLRGLGLTAPSVYAFLGVVPALENPPPVVAGDLPIAWCVSEEVAANISSIDGWPSVEGLDVVRNSIAPGFDTVERLGPLELKKLAIVSNHFPVDHLVVLQTLCSEMGITLEVIGLPDNSIEITPEHLVSCDAVVSLGRTAIAASGMGIPTLILDANGADGWLTPANLRQSQRHNFSGRGLGIEPDERMLRAWLQAPPSASDRRAVAEVIRRDHGFPRMLDRVEALLAQARTQTSIQRFGRHCGVVDDYIGRIVRQRTHIEILTEERDATARHRDVTLGERDDARRATEAALDERDRAMAERDDARQALDALQRSRSWRITAPARSMTGVFQKKST